MKPEKTYNKNTIHKKSKLTRILKVCPSKKDAFFCESLFENNTNLAS